MRPLAFLVGALALNVASRRPSRRVPVVARKRSPVVLPPVKVPASATGASAVGARHRQARDFEIDSLTVRKLKVTEELVMEPDSTKP